MILEPLALFFLEYGYDSSEIKEIVYGEKYLAVCLNNGQIGVCSSLATNFYEDMTLIKEPDLECQSHRVLYNAYLNARFNYSNVYNDTKDIFDEIDFNQCKKIVMVGYFVPLVKKFIDAGLELSIFDKVLEDDILVPYQKMGKYLAEAQHVILTATSVFNRSFMDVISQTRPGTNIYLLGPSSLLHPLMFNYPNLKKIYGSIFQPNDHRILEMIAEGLGTRSFLPFGRKVYIEA